MLTPGIERQVEAFTRTARTAVLGQGSALVRDRNRRIRAVRKNGEALARALREIAEITFPRTGDEIEFADDVDLRHVREAIEQMRDAVRTVESILLGPFERHLAAGAPDVLADLRRWRPRAVDRGWEVIALLERALLNAAGRGQETADAGAPRFVEEDGFLVFNGPLPDNQTFDHRVLREERIEALTNPR